LWAFSCGRKCPALVDAFPPFDANVVTDVPLYVRNLLVHGGIITIAFKPRFALITDRTGRMDLRNHASSKSNNPLY
jgi:hypothetical protein